MTAARRSAAVWAALAVVALALGDCARLVVGAETAPREADWGAAEAAVRAGFAPGDLIVAAPGWADPMMRLHLGDLVPVAVAARADSDRFGRIWEVSIRGAIAAEARPPSACTGILDGRVRVRRCDRPAARVLYDARAHLGEVVANRVRSGVALSFTPALIVGEVDYAPHQCMLVQPDLPGTVMRLEWPSVRLGRTLVGYAGMHHFHSRKLADGPVDVVVLIDDHEALRFTQRNRDGWRRFEIATRAGRNASVRVEISSAQPRERKLCLTWEARE